MVRCVLCDVDVNASLRSSAVTPSEPWCVTRIVRRTLRFRKATGHLMYGEVDGSWCGS